jgi:hypothetical protein
MTPSPSHLADLLTHLATLLATPPPALPLQWLAPEPLAFEGFSPDEQRHAYAEIRSLNPLRLSQHPGQPACLRLPPLSHIQPNTLYQFPTMVWEILDEGGEVLGQHTIQPGQFHTFAAGNPVSQVLEFMATILDYELAALGFNSRRERDQLCLIGQPGTAGLNLRVAQLRVESGQNGKICPLGLKTGQSTLDAQQHPGRSPATFWGHFSLNGETLCLSASHLYTPTLELAAEAILEKIHALSPKTGVSAYFDTHNHLVLRHQKPGSEGLIHLQNLPLPALPSGTEALPLQFPDGVTQGPEYVDPERLWVDLGHLVLNNIPIPLGRFSRQEHTPESLGPILLARINSRKALTGIEAQIHQGHIQLTLNDPERPLAVTALNDSQQQPLHPHPSGLSPIHIPAPMLAWQPILDTLHAIQTLLNTWSTPPVKLEEMLTARFPLGSGLRLSSTGQLEIEQTLLQTRITAFAPVLRSWAEQLGNTLRQLPPPMAATAPAPQPPYQRPPFSPPEAIDEEEPRASFDHQI